MFCGKEVRDFELRDGMRWNGGEDGTYGLAKQMSCAASVQRRLLGLKA